MGCWFAIKLSCANQCQVVGDGQGKMVDGYSWRMATMSGDHANIVDVITSWITFIIY
jgi:hypothetical protein